MRWLERIVLRRVQRRLIDELDDQVWLLNIPELDAYDCERIARVALVRAIKKITR